MKAAPGALADRETDAKYAAIRARYGSDSGRANGYRLHRYFAQEQKLLLELLGPVSGTVLDIACGSGLMGLPLKSRDCTVIGIDYNAIACAGAAATGITVVRGDVYRTPLADASVDHAFACQFFNQQDPAIVPSFLRECARLIKPGGRVVLVWRNHAAWVHRCAHALFRVLDRLTGRPEFPVYDHPLAQVAEFAELAGFAVTDRLVSFPLTGWRSRQVNGTVARAIGASSIIVLKRVEP